MRILKDTKPALQTLSSSSKNGGWGLEGSGESEGREAGRMYVQPEQLSCKNHVAIFVSVKWNMLCSKMTSFISYLWEIAVV